MAKIEKIGNIQIVDNKEDKFFYFPMISMACTGLKYNSKNIPMIVTNGIGTSQKAIRMFAPAEVVMIVLHRLTD